MPEMVSTEKGITLINRMVIVKTKQNQVSIIMYGTQRIRPIHATLENFNQLQMHCLYRQKKKLSYNPLAS